MSEERSVIERLAAYVSTESFGRLPEATLDAARRAILDTLGVMLAGSREETAVRARTLLAAPVIARATPALLSRLFRPARPDGQGAAFHASVARSSTAIGVAVALAVALLSLGALGLVVIAVGLLAALAVAGLLARLLGGVTGDVLGAAVEVSELTVLLTVSAWTFTGR